MNTPFYSRQHLEGLAVGCALTITGLFAVKLLSKFRTISKSKDRSDSINCVHYEAELYKSDDSFQSLFYGPESTAGSDGIGFPLSSKISSSALTVVHKEYIFLPKDAYKFAVEHLPIVSLSIFLLRSPFTCTKLR